MIEYEFRSTKPIIGYLEDEAIIRNNYTELLESDGYTVIACDTREQALERFTAAKIDLALLDVEIGQDLQAGMEVCRVLRERQPDLPIIFLTSHAHIDMKSRGWRLGADDYVTKDTEVELVLLRIRALIKRYARLKECFANTLENTPADTDLFIEESSYRVFWKRQLVAISLTQYWILLALVKGKGDAINHLQLQDAAKIFVEPNTIVAHIKAIRSAFREIDPDFSFIKTERGKGYRWAP